MSCEHEFQHREEAATIDGMCPLCLAARVAELETENALLRRQLREAGAVRESGG